MRRKLAALLAAGVVALGAPIPAEARLREVSVGNYWFEDDATGSSKQVVADEGDQIRFRFVETATPPHSAVVDGQFDSGARLRFQTYTTGPLRKPGTFRLYCRDHQDRGHVTTLVVRGSTSASPAPTASSPGSPNPKPKSSRPATAPPGTTPTATSIPAGGATTGPGTTPAPTAEESLAPVGVGEATDRSVPPPDPDSLAGLLGRRFGGEQPWTTALWLALLAMVPIAAVTAAALRRELQRGPATDGSVPSDRAG